MFMKSKRNPYDCFVVLSLNNYGTFSCLKHNSLLSAICILLYSSVSTYVGLYGSGVFNLGSYVSLPTLFACLLGFDIFFHFIENVFYYSIIIIICSF